MTFHQGSSCELFSGVKLRNFTEIYRKAFSRTLLIGQIGEPALVCAMQDQPAVGWRADCIGSPQSMERVTEKAKHMSDVWKRGHVSMESYWWLGEWKRKGWDLDDIIDATLRWHVSTFNAKSLPIPFEWRDKVDEWSAHMGYHFVIDRALFPETVRAGERVSLRIEVENVGVAPIYHRIPLSVRLKANDCAERFVTDIDIRRWIEGKYCEEIAFDLPSSFPSGVCSLQIGICGEGAPSVSFATTAPQDGDFSVLGEVVVNR